MRAFLFVLALVVGGGIAAAKDGSSGSGTTHVSFARRAEIGFPPGGESIPAIVRPEIARVAALLKTDLANAAADIEIRAYASEPKARVLALQRVVDVRLALVEAGLPAERIDVRVEKDGEPDKVVIFIHRRPP